VLVMAFYERFCIHPAIPAVPSRPAPESHRAGRGAQSVLQLWQHYTAAATRPVRWCLVAAAGPATLFYGMLLQVRPCSTEGRLSARPIHTLGTARTP
jgi:hypothetical protein